MDSLAASLAVSTRSTCSIRVLSFSSGTPYEDLPIIDFEACSTQLDGQNRDDELAVELLFTHIAEGQVHARGAAAAAEQYLTTGNLIVQPSPHIRASEVGQSVEAVCASCPLLPPPPFSYHMLFDTMHMRC